MITKSVGFSFFFIIAIAACGDANYFKNYDKGPEGLDKIASALESGNPEKAKSAILDTLPTASQLIITNSNPDYDNDAFSKQLADSMSGVDDGAELLSLYSNAEAQSAGVNALTILVKVSQLETTTTSLVANDEAIGKFGPAMPEQCKKSSSSVLKSMDLSEGVALAASMLRSLDTKEDLLNRAIFSEVAIICRVLNLDSDSDGKISADEAKTLTSDDAVYLYNRLVRAIDRLKAVAERLSTVKSLKKAYERVQSYKDKIDASTGTDTTEKLRAFLITNSK